MDVLGQAKTLGQAIAQSQEFQALLEKEKEFYGNSEAVELLKQYDKEMMKIKNLQALGLAVPATAMESLEELQGKIQASAPIQQLLSTQRTYEELLRKVNEEINREIERVTKEKMGSLEGDSSGPSIIMPA